MNNPLKTIQLPDVPHQGDISKYHGMAKAMLAMYSWVNRLTTRLNSTLQDIRTQLNTQVQGFGDDLDSTGDLVLTNANHHVIGSGAVDTIVPPAGFTGPIFLVADGAFSLTTGGNIAVAAGPFTVGQEVTLTYDAALDEWFPAIGSGGGGGAVTSVSGGAGIGVAPTTGAVIVSAEPNQFLLMGA